MKHPRQSLSASVIVFITTMATSLFVTLATSGAATPLDTNLIVNGDAEASPGAANYTDTLAPSGWTIMSNFTVVRYSAATPSSGQLSSTESATFGGGANFFAGGSNNADSSASQVIDISDRAADIDSGQLTVVLSGFFGGVSGQDDGMTLGAQLLNKSGQQYAATLIGNVQNAERQGASGLLYRSRNLSVPGGTRSIVVTLRATRANTSQDTYNDGYADNVSLELVKTGGVNSFAQSFGNPFNPTTDTGPGLDYTRGTAPMPDGGVVVVGVVGKNFHNAIADDVLIRYGADGTILWQKEFPDSGYGYALCLVTTDPQGNVYFASAFQPDKGAGIFWPFVAKFDVNGVQQWFTNVQVPVSDIPNNSYSDQNTYINSPFTGMYLSPDGNLLLGTGLYDPVQSGITIPAIVTVNATTGAASCLGLDTSSPRVDTTAGSAASSLCRSLTSSNMAFLTTSADRGYELVLVDASGKPVATRESVGGPYAFMIPTADGGLLVVNGGVVQKFGADLTLQFQKIESDFQPFSVVQTPDGGYLLSARGSVANNPNYTGSKVFLVKLDSLGRLDRAEAFGGSRDENRNYFSSYPSTAVLTTDGGIGLATMTTSYTGDTTDVPDWWVVKADKLGRIANFQDLMVDVSTQILMRDATAQNGFPPPGNGIAFDKPKPFAINNPAKPVGGRAIPQTLNSTDPSATIRVQAQAAFPAPPPPPHGGVGGTDFTVNGSYTVFKQNIPDTVLHFAAGQTSHAAGLLVKVQASQSPTIESTWTDLVTGRAGLMTFDTSSQQFILNTTSYPLQNGVYFRAISAASGYIISISNVVGPFNLASNQTHLGPTLLTGTANGNIADLYFDATQSTSAAALRVQLSATPANEASWTDLNDGVGGHMQPSSDPQHFLLLENKLPATSDVYFRAVAHLDGAIDSLSGAIGPVTVTPHTPPSVTITPPSGLAGSGDGSEGNPISVAAGQSFSFSAIPTKGTRPLARLTLQFGGQTLTSFTDNLTSGSTYTYATAPADLGDFTLTASAIDDRNVISRAIGKPGTPNATGPGTGTFYLRVVPPASSNKSSSVPGSSQQTAAGSLGSHYYKVATDGGVWTDPATWVDQLTGTNGVPGPNDLAVIAGLSVRFTLDVTVGSVTINGGHLVGPGNVTVLHKITIYAGSFDNYIGLFIEPSATCELLNGDTLHLTGKIYNKGVINVHGSAGLDQITQFSNQGGFTFQLPISIPKNAGIDPAAASRRVATATADNAGKIGGVNAGSIISENGLGLISEDGTGIVGGCAGCVASLVNAPKVVSHDGGSVISNDGGSVISNDGGSVVSHDGGSVIGINGGNVLSTNGSTFGASGNFRSDTVPSGFSQNGGETNLSSVSIVGPVTVNGGVLSGSGLIQGDLTNNGGYIAPGHSAGLIGVTGNFTQGSNGTLIVENGGPYPSQFDQLQIGGSATLGGKLEVKLINGYTPDPADTFNPLGYGSVSGSFSSISSNAQVTVNASGLLTSVDPTKPNPTNGQPLNIATRLQIQSGDNVLIGGFIITGPAGSTKNVLIRGIGPSLAAFGVVGTIPDPFLELHKPDGSVVSNDNWKQAPNVADIPAGFAPSNDLESIIYTTLSPGNYTAILKGANGETGIGLVEAYDFDTTSTAKLANIATRGFVNTGDNVMIGGFIIGGTEPAKVLVRAIGPSLIPFGVQGALRATTLELHDSNGSVISNESWRSTQESEIIATTIAPTNDNEAAILATLVPGNYTAVVRGKNNTTGIAVVEAYSLQ